MTPDQKLKQTLHVLHTSATVANGLLKDGQITDASAELDFFKHGLESFSTQLGKTDGGFFGVNKILRHPYRVADEVKADFEGLKKTAQQLTHQIEKSKK